MITQIEKIIDEIILKTKGRQMTKEEYSYISSFLGNVNFLVFGAGYDSKLWRFANNNGNTIFLENNKQWITNNKDTFRVFYTTNITQANELLKNYKEGDKLSLLLSLPTEILNTKWDCILIDSPEGWNNSCPGRMQSIYTAKILSNENTDIFLHDCDRYVENLYSEEFFKSTVRELTKLKHFKLTDNND